MANKIKLLWDFRGPDAKETAKHHTTHLKEYAILNQYKYANIKSKYKHQ